MTDQKNETKTEALKGRIHSFQSLGAVDGPGIRFVIFTQGCPYRCPYCHNPDTRSFSGGSEYTALELVEKIKRYKSYFGEKGGVTVSGGEPLMQSVFLTELFEKLHEAGINTALDTAGAAPNDAIRKLLSHTDTVLCDIKFPSDAAYREHLGIGLNDVLDFLRLCDEARCRVIVRHVVVPGLTDSAESVRKVYELAKSVLSDFDIELLPFRKLCTAKYEKLGIPFPLANTPECSEEKLAELKNVIKDLK